MTTWTVPSNTHNPGDTGHTTDHNSIAGDLSLIGAILPAVTGGLTGAAAVTRFVGATASGAPTSGTFAIGDWIVDQSGTIWICTVAGTQGTWVALCTVSTTQTVSGAKTFSSVVAHSAGTNTSGTATASTPSLTSGTAAQINTTQDVMLYASVTTAATFSLAIGPTSTPATTIVASATDVAHTLFTVRVPAGWYVKSTFTSGDITWTAVTC